MIRSFWITSPTESVQIQPIAADIVHSMVCMSVCVLAAQVCSVKIAKLKVMLFWGQSKWTQETLY